MNKENKKIAIGVLAYNVAKYVHNVIDELQDLNLHIYIINDSSTDDTKKKLEVYKENTNITVISNSQNLGAGYSLKKLIKAANKDGFGFLIKVDGDGQFKTEDVKKIVKLYKENEYELIRCNRFWSKGIEGNIPRKRLFGNLVATIMLQVICGTNKVYDPLNGLFGIATKVTSELDVKYYPKRYGYPFFFSALAIIKEYKTYQLNNIVVYEEQDSNLSPLRVLLTLIKLFFKFYYLKIKQKQNIGSLQRSALFDKVSLFFIANSIVLSVFMIYELVFDLTFARILTLIILNLFFLLAASFFFISGYKDERSYRESYITSENIN